ncbi:MAG TPA: ATP-binding protein [Bryobacteraceae bacterium]|nr:ATP-binding protein [Bryobacteraceae bacterium]
MPAKQLRDKNLEFRLLFEENPQPMWVMDPPSRRFLAVNRAAARLYGYSEDEFLRMTLSDLQSEEESRRPPQAGIPSNAGPASSRHVTRTGRAIDVEVAIQPVQYREQAAELAVVWDITARRQLEEQLRQAQKMEAVGMLAGGVAHDFNNLLTIITGYSQLILNNLRVDDGNRNSVEQIMRAGERAAALTRQLLAFSRRQVLQPKVLDLNRLVTSLTAMLRRLIGEDVDLRLVLRPDLGRVHADPGQIEQVIMNLVVNARDAMPKGGILTVETSNVELDHSYASRHIEVKSGPYVMLAVSDNGAGMDEATRARLFEPFFTTKGAGRGTGLGLSTVFGIVKQSGGSLQVYSEPGTGTSVKVFLPRIEQPVALDPEAQRKVVRRGHETILLVEDDEMVRSLVRETLQRDGYTVLDADGPDEARRASKQYHGVIHLLITDVVMPKTNGRELAEQLTARRPGMKVLYMSGYTDSAIASSGVLTRDNSFLQKPFTPFSLADKVREVLESENYTRRVGGE